MSSLIQYFKKAIEHLPPCLGKLLSFVPYKYKLGRSYVKYCSLIKDIPDKEYIYSSMASIVTYAYKNIPFYKDHYERNNFEPDDLKNFDDIKNIPIIKKSDLKKRNLSERSSVVSEGIKTNTGGTTGQPLSLLHDSESYSREWAHMHHAWKQLGYKPTDFKLTIRGMNLGNKPVIYNALQNEYRVNAYCSIHTLISALFRLIQKKNITFIHGYPSAIYELVKSINKFYPHLLKLINRTLKGILFCSEYPIPKFRQYIEEKLQVPTLSWYGHTEMAVLAPERETPYIYKPFQGSYGYAEALSIENKTHLIGTTLHNYISPLIRYDTGDLIKPVEYNEEILTSFSIKEGRIGDFVIDKNGRSISLTSLIFGRHHPVFNIVDFVQIAQEKAGEMYIALITDKKNVNYSSYFDSSNIDMDFKYITIDKPVKSESGKISLKVDLHDLLK